MINSEQMNGKFTQLKGQMKQTWGKLTDNDLMLYEGKRDQFMGKLKEHYGLAREDAEKKIKAMEEHSGYGKEEMAAKPARMADKHAM